MTRPGRTLLRRVCGLWQAVLLAGILGCLSAQTFAAPWAVAEAQAPDNVAERFTAAGWNCTRVLELPGAAPLWLALCRRPPQADAELWLVLLESRPSALPREFARLADASQVRMRLFKPDRPCAAAPGVPCLRAVVLVDQRDESSCYGTQVIVAVGGRPLLSLGYINEMRLESGEEHCIGAFATVSGSARSAQIELPGPLARSGRNGRVQSLAVDRVYYRISAARPALQRQSTPR